MKNSKWLLNIATLLVVLHLPTGTLTFDYFKLCLQWPPTIKKANYHLPEPMNFTIHGLWPHNFSTFAMLPCKAQAAYTPVTGDLFGRLEISWPDITNGIEQDFWKREWDSHGGCSETTYDQMAFLTLAANLNDKHNILSSLLAANLARHTSAKLQDFESAIKYHTTKLPDLACIWDNKLWMLWEVRICYDSSTLEIIDCPTNLQYGRNCAARSGSFLVSLLHNLFWTMLLVESIFHLKVTLDLEVEFVGVIILVSVANPSFLLVDELLVCYRHATHAHDVLCSLTFGEIMYIGIV
ncbi:hypothetical protein RHGRI_028615 [Rhododendron griersonianum]|uniref:Uncharacterized protein n=1 Tax=Rhododendron griersonianum TaxID=479676 RepID=A0AAV6IIR4_9ERIC|nr:hypothetical protein RHGRI_028615 [Rhododendron griersonianum]